LGPTDFNVRDTTHFGCFRHPSSTSRGAYLPR
jgi:hypothetical protein